MEKTPIRVLLVDDDKEEFEVINGILSIIVSGHYKLDWADTYEAALERIARAEHEVYLLDYRLLGSRTGLDLLREAKRRGCQAPMILLTGVWDSAVDHQALREGAADYLVKGQFGPDVLERSLRYAIERAKALAALRESEAKYRSIVETTQAILFSADPNGRLTYVNEAGGKTLGIAPERLLGRSFLRFIHRDDLRNAVKTFKDRLQGEAGSAAAELRVRGAEGRQNWLNVSLSLRRPAKGPAELSGVAVDVTERRRLQGMFIQAEKLSAMGLLAAGVAHELNNPLSVILAQLDVALASLPESSAAAKKLLAVKKSAGRCRDLVQNLLVFARKEESAPQDVALSDCVAEALALVEPQARFLSLDLRRELSREELFIRGVKNQIEQVLVNLANNAIDAMSPGGRLTVRTRGVERSGRRFVEIQIADTGKGIPKAALKSIFEPFFTTKGPGKGTGLGLALVSDIVTSHGGTIDVASETGKGSVFSLYFPRIEFPR